jgi:hypothetical protein
MEHPRFNWGARIALLSQWYSIRLARKKGLELRQAMGTEQWEALIARAAENSRHLDLSSVPDQFRSFLFSPESMLCHPLLVHYIRPAMRMASAAGYVATGVPVITNPNLTFGGHAFELEPSALKIAEIPLGLVFLFRELGRGILNLHNAIQNEQERDIPPSSKACLLLSSLIYQPATVVFQLGETLFKKTSFKNKLYATQITHVLGVFVILHEIGHICKGHNLTPFSEEESKRQEHEADIFAVECLFAPKRDNPRYAPFRKIQMIAVCNLLTLMDIHADASAANLYGYPSFKERRLKLLGHFGATDGVSKAVTEAISSFELEVRRSPADIPNLRS